MRRRATKLALILAGLLAGSAVAEGLLRVFKSNLQFDINTHVANEHDFIGRAGRTQSDPPVTLTFDADGFRVGSGLPYDKSVLFIGDSFTRGEGVNDFETFARFTEQSLRAQGIRARSLNTGVQGLGAAQELRLMRTLLERITPDAIVVEVLPQNDLTDNWADGGFGLDSGKLIEFSPPHKPPSIRVRTFVCADSFLERLLVVRGITDLLVPNDFFVSPGDLEAYDLERALLHETVDLAHKKSVPILIAVTPTAQQLGEWAGDGDAGEAMGRYDRFVGIASGLDAPSIDLRKTLKDPEADYNKRDSHFSVLGNRLVGETLARELLPLLRK